MAHLCMLYFTACIYIKCLCTKHLTEKVYVACSEIQFKIVNINIYSPLGGSTSVQMNGGRRSINYQLM